MSNMDILEIIFVKTKSEKVIVRADVHFEGFLLKGFKVLRNDETGREYVTPPSYLSAKGWRPIFKTDNPATWQKIQEKILDEFDNKQIADFADEALTKD